METMTDKEIGPLGNLFNQIILNLKSGPPVWEEFFGKTTRFCSSLRTTISALSAFLEAFQKVADLVANTRGSSREIGMYLTRLSMRHKGIEKKLTEFVEALMESLINPLQGKMEEWKKITSQLDKEHNKDIKRVRSEMKKMSTNTLKLQKKVKKGKSGAQDRLSCAMEEMSEMNSCLDIAEEKALRAALLEEHRQFCYFVGCFRPALDKELSLLEDIAQMKDITDNLYQLTRDSTILSATTEQAIVDIKGGSAAVDMQTILNQTASSKSSPPPSPRSLGSRKSSMCSISSTNSSSSGSAQIAARKQTHYPQALHSCIGVGPLRVSSHDSGFISQDTLYHGGDVNAKHADNSLGERTSSVASNGLLNSGVSMWANWPGLPASKTSMADRPHTISAAFAHSQPRPQVTEDTFVTPTQQNANTSFDDSLDLNATINETVQALTSSLEDFTQNLDDQFNTTVGTDSQASDLHLNSANNTDQFADLGIEYFDSLLADLNRYATLPNAKSSLLGRSQTLKPSHDSSLGSSKSVSGQGVFKCPPPTAPKRQSSISMSRENIYNTPRNEPIYQVPRPINATNPSAILTRKSSITSLESSSSGGYSTANDLLSADAISALPPPPQDFFEDPLPADPVTSHIFERRMSDMTLATNFRSNAMNVSTAFGPPTLAKSQTNPALASLEARRASMPSSEANASRRHLQPDLMAQIHTGVALRKTNAANK